MSVTTLTPVAIAKNVATADIKIAGGTAINASNTMEVAYPQEGSLLILINNTYAGSKTATISAGDFLAAGQGDLAVPIGQDEVVGLVLSSDRFKQSTGVISISFAASMTGFVKTLSLP